VQSFAGRTLQYFCFRSAMQLQQSVAGQLTITNGQGMAAIHDLISQISDPRLRERLLAEWKAASTGKKFGLVFEDHLPELLPLPSY